MRLALVDDGAVSLAACTAAGCQAEAWPTALEPLRRRLERASSAPGQAIPFRPAMLVDDPPTLLLPLFDAEADERPGQHRPRFRVNGVVLLELDLSFLSSRVLPQIAEASLGSTDDSDFAISLVRRRDRSILYTTEPDAAAGELRRAEVELPAPFGSRAGGGAGREKREARRGRPDRPRMERDEDAPWLLLVRHRGGTLEQAVAAVRRRNLAVGLGVIALLGAAGVLLASGAQRARGLARQQLEFIAGITHELNTPLAAIRSAGQNLADGIVTDPQQVRRYGGLIEKEGSRLTSLVAQVLDFAGIESGVRAYASDPVSLRELVDAVLADMRLVLQQSCLEVRCELPAHLPPVAGDAAALRRVLANVLANAVKFAASGRLVVVSGATGGRGVILRVVDHGPGIPPRSASASSSPSTAAARRSATRRPAAAWASAW